MKESVVYQEILAEGKLKGKLEGKLEGELQGKLKEARKIALNLLNMGMTVEQVAQVTELSVKDVENLRT